MSFLKLIRFSAFQILSIISLIIFLLGALNIHFSDRNNFCVMTYMFEYPQFVRISLPENKVYPQYGLYAYSEGRLTERARKMWFDGVPVLFLPGNSGSHMQARSLASVALRKAISSEVEYHFDFFTISFNEELSGLYGGVLQSQTSFASACISRILNLYKSNKYTKTVPTSVILIGHSMGGVIAKRLLAYTATLNTTLIAISLAAPLEAPVINFDATMSDYYMLMNFEWKQNIERDPLMKERKMLFSFGNGPRDVLMPSGLTSSNDSFISALTTAVPGVWVSPDHVSIVWCKQLVLTITRFLFDVVDPLTNQIVEDRAVIKDRALQHFQANRSMTLSPNIKRPNAMMQVEAFWYEDNRRIYQISRPEIVRTTYLMIRLVSFHQNRFVAVEGVNVDDKDWLFGCNANLVNRNYRYCKQATSLTELSRWTGAATDFGLRKLATVHLHSIMESHPDWTHVIVKVSPTRKPIVLNVDINDLASRQITVDLPSYLNLGKSIVKQETEANSLYYELILPGFNAVHQAYLLYVEPTAGCKAAQYHVSAEIHVPWAKNHESYHYFTHLKRSPMKLRLFKTNPNITAGGEATEHVKVTLLLDPQCTFTISVSQSWYHTVGRWVREYGGAVVAHVAGVVLLAARSSLLAARTGACVHLHHALDHHTVRPYYALVFARLGVMVFTSIPILSFLFESASWDNRELQYFSRSLLVLPTYMTAVGIVNVAVAGIVLVMVFSSQLAHKLLFRIIWRGGSSVAEKVASGLQKLPLFVSAALVTSAPLSCGAAALAAGAAYYAFMISKMYEEYLEDYVYKIMAKMSSRLCRMFKSNKNTNKDTTPNNDTCLVKQTNNPEDTTEVKQLTDGKCEDESKALIKKEEEETKEKNSSRGSRRKAERRSKDDGGEDFDEDLSNLNFHMMMFMLWLCVAIVNIPALLTWARNFKYSMVLKPDTSYHTGLAMSACSACVWQMEGPRRNLKYYDQVAAFVFTMAVFILALGPFSLYIINYGVTLIFIVITLQQLFDQEDLPITSAESGIEDTASKESEDKETNEEQTDKAEDTSDKKETDDTNEGDSNISDNGQEKDNTQTNASDEKSSECDPCNENRIYNLFKNLKEKFSFSEEL